MPAERIPYALPHRTHDRMRERADALLTEMNGRRSCRYFSDRPVPRDIIQRAVAVANTAPSGANRQPWRFVAVDDSVMKREIRAAAEIEERESYDHRMPAEWLEALEPIGTDANKPFLEIAPWLVIVFRIDWEWHKGDRVKNYYPIESVGLATGFFLMACHQIGLATLTHTPSPMGFLRDIAGGGPNEKPFLLIPVGYPADDCTVPRLPKKTVEQVLQWNRPT
ncbi:MAG: nitroreductase family protein [Phycisphaerales bacterium]|nr:nitroreductase family protein [Phycisphaerales bacterium]